MSFNWKLFSILALVSLLGCKDIKSSSSQTVVAVSSEIEYSEKASCSIPGFEISLLNDEKSSNYLRVKAGTSVLLKELRIDSLSSVSDIELKCDEGSFQLLFTEQLGNNYQTTVHSFVRHDEFKFVMNGVYVRTSDRNGISLTNKSSVRPIKIDDYNGMLSDIRDDDLEIYSFNGFQEEKEPAIDMYFDKVRSSKANKASLERLSNKVVLNFILENIEINADNLASFNDIAFYFEQAQFFEEAIYLLEPIINEHPDRTVAYINLGDAYWGINQMEDAKKSYRTYVNQMTEKGLENKIPQRILDRI